MNNYYKCKDCRNEGDGLFLSCLVCGSHNVELFINNNNKNHLKIHYINDNISLKKKEDIFVRLSMLTQ